MIILGDEGLDSDIMELLNREMDLYYSKKKKKSSENEGKKIDSF